MRSIHRLGALAALLLPFAALAQEPLPGFADHAVEPVEIQLERIDPLSHPRADSLRSHLRPLPRAANFAGHYLLQAISCGISCEELAIIDARDGRVFMPLHRSFSHGAAFRHDSRLLILNPAENIRAAGDHEDPPDWLCTEHFAWEDEELKPLHRQCGREEVVEPGDPSGAIAIRPGTLYYRLAYHQPMQRTLQILGGDHAPLAELVLGDCGFGDSTTGITHLPLEHRADAKLLVSCLRADDSRAVHLVHFADGDPVEMRQVTVTGPLHISQTHGLLTIDPDVEWELNGADAKLEAAQAALLGQRPWLETVAAGEYAGRLVRPSSPDLPLRLGPHEDSPWFRRVGDDLLIHLDRDEPTPFWRAGGFSRVCQPSGACGYVHARELEPFSARPLERNALAGLDVEEPEPRALAALVHVVAGDHPDALARALMAANYGEHRPDDDCWLARHEGEDGLRHFCMRLLRAERLDRQGRTLVVAGGYEQRESGEVYDCPECSGYLGLFLAEPAGEGWRLVAQRPFIPHGAAGRVPAPEAVQALRFADTSWGAAIWRDLPLRDKRVRNIRLFGLRDERLADMGVLAWAEDEHAHDPQPTSWEFEGLEALEQPGTGHYPLVLKGWRRHEGETWDYEVVVYYDRQLQGYFYAGDRSPPDGPAQ
jgi:hypothetical protein